MTYSRTAPAQSNQDAGLGRQLKFQWNTRGRKFAPLATIVLGHALLFYMFQSGMMRQAAHAMMPQVVNITFVASPEPLKPSPPPKTVQVARQVPTFVPPLPLLNIPQVEPTITVAPQAPRSSEPPTTASVAPVSTSAPAPTPPASPKTVSGVEYIRAPQAIYPNIARRLGETGVVIVRVLIGEKGLPEQAIVQKSSGSTNLDEAGRRAALNALYKPYIEDGKAVAVYVLVPINFQLG